MRNGATHMNGSNKAMKVPMIELASVTLASSKEPKSWSTALEICRREVGWTQNDLLTHAFGKDPNVNLAVVKRWETAHALPSTAQCQKLRAILPALFKYDHLLPLDRQASPKEKVGPGIPTEKVIPQGWPGPAVANFQEALRWCMKQTRTTFRDLELPLGVTTSAIGGWGDGRGRVIVRQNYEKLVKMYPALAHAPKPPFSMLSRPMRKKGYLRSVEAGYFEAREERREEPAPDGAPAQPAPPPGPDRSKLQAASAALGIYAGELASLKVQALALKRRHNDELTALGERQKAEEETLAANTAATQKLLDEQHAIVESEASAMHEGHS